MKTLVEHEMILKDDIPVSLPARRLPHSQRGEITGQLEDLLAQDIIEPSRTPYGSSIVTVKKRKWEYANVC